MKTDPGSRFPHQSINHPPSLNVLKALIAVVTVRRGTFLAPLPSFSRGNVYMMSDVIRMMAIVDVHFICITTSPWGVGSYSQ